eukprot:CAMPEP_0202881380 /NCGR_PEP_ID=MMETSP1391-20130828/36444_1 /ASSEMBLY_ACC=CAM_ASM_000867 /TAXON_ID=1034604 /ORGANISM="Chlamydomonas leiostraca, Strain SAG 11-49" /LENGTH=46 /DNA_ID= /DNA_START= /DNA_END= /DNA_ORIENTATION=
MHTAIICTRVRGARRARPGACRLPADARVVVLRQRRLQLLQPALQQ